MKAYLDYDFRCTICPFATSDLDAKAGHETYHEDHPRGWFGQGEAHVMAPTGFSVKDWDDEALNEWVGNFSTPFIVRDEIARRAEIRLNRMADVSYGDNRYGFTLDDIKQPHDGSWYNPRQTEDEFLNEMGA